MPQNPWLPVMPDVLDILQSNACIVETKLYCLVRKTAVMFLTRKAFLFRRGDDLTVFLKSDRAPERKAVAEPDIFKPRRLHHFRYLRVCKALFETRPETVERVCAHRVKTVMTINRKRQTFA